MGLGVQVHLERASRPSPGSDPETSIERPDPLSPLDIVLHQYHLKETRTTRLPFSPQVSQIAGPTVLAIARPVRSRARSTSPRHARRAPHTLTNFRRTPISQIRYVFDTYIVHLGLEGGSGRLGDSSAQDVLGADESQGLSSTRSGTS